MQIGQRSVRGIEIRVLGPVEVVVDGAAAVLGGPRQQAVLAMLVAARGRTVPVERIVRHLWQGTPPPRALASLQAYISRLRKAVEPGRAPRGEASVLVLEPTGYALRLPADAVDAWCLEHEVRAAAECPPGPALRILRQALARRRGRPFEQFETEPWALPEVERLGEVLLAGRQREIRCLLRLGHTGDAVPAARDLAGANPSRDDVCWLHALALWAAHRSAEALDVLRRHRRTAAAGRPDPSLAELEQAILEQRGDVLEGHLRFGEVPGGPAQLPRTPATFAARTAELAALDRLEDGLVVIAGPGGVGKTTVALHWAHRVAGRFPDGQLHADLRGFGPDDNPADPADVLAGFLGVLGVPDQRVPPGEAARAALFRSVLAGRRVLLVLDNARDAGQVRPLLPGTAGCTVVVTSRDALSGLVVTEGAQTLRLGVFRDDESRAYLRARLGPVVDADPEATGTIVARCGGLPLALAVVCARADGVPLATVAAGLAGDESLDAVFSWSYRQLPGEAAALFRRLALHPGPDVTVGAAANVSGTGRAATRAVLRSLADAHLLRERKPGRFDYHDLVRGYAVRAAGREDPPEVGADVVRRLTEYHLYTARNAATRYMTYPVPDVVGTPPDDIVTEEFADAAAALAWMAADYDNVMALAAACDERYLGPLVGALVSYQQDFRFLVADSIALCRRALVVAERGDEDWWVRYLIFLIARGHLWRGEMDQARPHLERVIALSRVAGRPISIAQGLIALVTAITGYIGTPEPAAVREAYPYAVEALENYQVSLNDPIYGPTAKIGTARSLLTIAWWHFYFGDGYDAAAAMLDESLRAQLRIDNGQHAAEALLNIGYLRHSAGDPAGAVTAFRRVLDEHGDVAEHRVDPLIGLYLVHMAAGDGEAADRVRAQAAELAGTARYHDAERLRAVLGGRGAPR